MNPRERLLAIALLAIVILVGCGFMALKFLVEPFRDRSASAALLQQDIDKRRLEIQKIMAEKAKLDRWQRMSLPADVDLAQREYEKFLSDLLRQSKFPTGVSRVIPPKQIDTRSSGTLPGRKEPIYSKLIYSVETHGELSNLVTFLERFYKTGLMHQIKRLTVQRPMTLGPNQRPNGLDIRLTIEALVVQGAENRPYLAPVEQRLLVMETVTSLRRGPNGLAFVCALAGPAGPLGPRTLAEPARQYASITGKNIFYGPSLAAEKAPSTTTEVDKTDVLPFVFLTDITHSPTKIEAFLFDRYNTRRIRLQASVGFDTFRIRNAQGDTLVAAKVVAIHERDCIIVAGDQFYAVHVGQNLKEAMAKPLTELQLKEMGVAASKGQP